MFLVVVIVIDVVVFVVVFGVSVDFVVDDLLRIIVSNAVSLSMVVIYSLQDKMAHNQVTLTLNQYSKRIFYVDVFVVVSCCCCSHTPPQG